MYRDALGELRKRRIELRDAIAKSIYEADDPQSPWYSAADSDRARCRVLADAAVATTDRYDSGLLEWLADAEGEMRECMTKAAADLGALIATETAFTDHAVEQLVAIAARLAGPGPLPRRRPPPAFTCDEQSREPTG